MSSCNSRFCAALRNALVGVSQRLLRDFLSASDIRDAAKAKSCNQDVSPTSIQLQSTLRLEMDVFPAGDNAVNSCLSAYAAQKCFAHFTGEWRQLMFFHAFVIVVSSAGIRHITSRCRLPWCEKTPGDVLNKVGVPYATLQLLA